MSYRGLIVFWCFFAALVALWAFWPKPQPERPYCWPTPNEPEQCG